MTNHTNENLSSERNKDDKDPALRPQFLNEFIGQSELRENLSVFIVVTNI